MGNSVQACAPELTTCYIPSNFIKKKKTATRRLQPRVQQQEDRQKIKLGLFYNNKKAQLSTIS